MWKREWTTLVSHPNGRTTKRIRSWDLAFTRPSEQNTNPDWTRGVLISKDKTGVYTVEDMVGIRDRVHEVEKLIFETAIRDGQDVTISIPQDPNAAAGAYARDLQRKLADMGFTVKLVRPVKSKLTRFAPFASVTQAGFVNVVEGDWNKGFFEELENFDGDGKKKDDQVDVCSDAFWCLNRELELPFLALPTDLVRSDSFGFQSNTLPTDFSAGIPVGFN
jgi:predicted phage terminase large subunit-like protein